MSYPIDGPHRIGVYPTPSGARIDISHYLTSLILSLAEAATEHGESLLDELREIADVHSASTGADSHAAHQRDQLVTELLEGLGHEGEMTVYGPGLYRLADALLKAARRHVPGPRGERAA